MFGRYRWSHRAQRESKENRFSFLAFFIAIRLARRDQRSLCSQSCRNQSSGAMSGVQVEVGVAVCESQSLSQ